MSLSSEAWWKLAIKVQPTTTELAEMSAYEAAETVWFDPASLIAVLENSTPLERKRGYKRLLPHMTACYGNFIMEQETARGANARVIMPSGKVPGGFAVHRTSAVWSSFVEKCGLLAKTEKDDLSLVKRILTTQTYYMTCLACGSPTYVTPTHRTSRKLATPLWASDNSLEVLLKSGLGMNPLFIDLAGICASHAERFTCVVCKKLMAAEFQKEEYDALRADKTCTGCSKGSLSGILRPSIRPVGRRLGRMPVESLL